MAGADPGTGGVDQSCCAVDAWTPGSDARGGRVFRARATAPGGAVRLVLACFARAPAPPARDPTRAGPRGRPSCVIYLYSDYKI